VWVAGAISCGLAGEELAAIGSLRQAGVVAITDDGYCVQNNELMRRALEYARDVRFAGAGPLPGLLDRDRWHDARGLLEHGVGFARLARRGEEIIVARNVHLAELTGAHVHCQHISSARSVRLVREAKARGIPLSAEACPHHFTLTDAAVAGSDKFWAVDGAQVFGLGDSGQTRPVWPAYDTRFKMNPPLRSAADREAVLEGIADGTLEVLASDHAPHCDYEKEVEFDEAPFGITGLETELALALMQLFHSGRLGLPELLSRFTSAPARILRLNKGTLSVGADADVTVIDPDAEWVFRKEDTASRARNSPFYDWPLRGRAVLTLVSGEDRLAARVKTAARTLITR
jgi:dihydroorotase